jgi:hypothetical protein
LRSFILSELDEMADVAPAYEEEEKKVGYYESVKGDYNVEAVPVYDDAGPVEFAEKRELRLVTDEYNKDNISS